MKAFRIKYLESCIEKYAQQYYEDGSSPISDAEFDELVAELTALNPNSELLKVGYGYSIDKDSTPGAKCRHKYGTVGSLSKCRTWKEIGPELSQCSICASLKLDGISVVLYYEKGELVQALTRGENNIGIDITEKVRYIDDSIINILDDTFTGAVRGELLMSYDNFEKFKELHPNAENARNSTAGLKNANGITPDLKFLDIVVYTVIGDEGVAPYPYNPSSCLDMHQIVTWLRQNFKNVAPYAPIHLFEDNYNDSMNKLRSEWYGKYPADGIVLTNMNVGYNKSTFEVIYTAKAFKFPAESKNTEVLDVEWSLSKSRYLIPKIKLSTVRLSGTNVSYCTGYNAKYIQDNNISPGAIVEVEKRGEIIPNINKVIVSGKANLPTHCPDCGEELVWEGVHLKCSNPECNNADKQDLIVWLDNISPVDGLGDSIRLKYLEMILDEGEDLSIETVMKFPETGRHVIFSNAKGGHKQLISNMMDQLFNPEVKIPARRAIQALNVPRFGEITSEKFAYAKDLFRALMECACEGYELPDCSNILGVANMASVRENLSKFKRLKYIWDRIEFTSTETENSEDKGKVAITGKLSIKRSEFEKELRAAGYHPAEISKDTKFLITDNPNSSSSKNKKADEWGIEKITESEFRLRYM